MPILADAVVPKRRRQWGYQGSNSTLITTPVAAVRVMPYRGPLSINPNFEFADVDDGTLTGVQAPQMGRHDVTASIQGPLAYDDLPFLLTPSLHGGVTPTGGGAAKTWAFQPNVSSPSSSPLGMITEEWGDVDTDFHQGVGGVFETLEISGEVGSGALQVSGTLRFAKGLGESYTDYQSGTVPTPALTIDDTPAWVYLDDCELFINDTAGAIGTTKITDALQSLRLSITNEFDLKTPANGSNTRFQIQSYGRGKVTIDFEATYHKTTQIVTTGSEVDKWLRNTPIKRFVELRFTSPEIITGSTPYSWVTRLPIFNLTREDGEVGSNTTVTLAGQAKYDSTLTYAIRSVPVVALTSLT